MRERERGRGEMVSRKKERERGGSVGARVQPSRDQWSSHLGC